VVGEEAFEHHHWLPLTCERERSGEPAKSAADDEDWISLVHMHVLNSDNLRATVSQTP
jgi:hypothetical protein